MMRHALPAAALLAAALLLAAPLRVAADPTDFLSTALHAPTDAQDCGELGEGCCLRKSGAQRCNAPDLACRSDGSNPRCVSCGGFYEPACNGAKCDAGLVASTAELICSPGAPQGRQATRQRGAAGLPGSLARRKQDDALSRTFGATRACSADADCGNRSACRSGVCVPCGRPNQACCANSRCRGFGRRGVTCQYDTAQGNNMCVAPDKSGQAQ